MKVNSVEPFLDSLGHAQRDLIDELRRHVLASDSALIEGMKWNAPSYALDSQDIITFNFRNYGTIALIFHTGPKGKDTHTGINILEDDSGEILWLADKRFVIKIPDTGYFHKHRDWLAGRIREWTELSRAGFIARTPALGHRRPPQNPPASEA